MSKGNEKIQTSSLKSENEKKATERAHPQLTTSFLAKKDICEVSNQLT